MSETKETKETKETVEQLAKRIASVHGGYFADYYHRIARFLRSHGIDPATMQPVGGEKVQCEPLTDEQVDRELAEAGIDMAPAIKRLHEMVDKAKASREVIVSSESAWLIEVPHIHSKSGSPLWYAGIGQGAACHGKHGWTYDACKAMRFDDKHQAEAYIDEHKLREKAWRLIVTQHGFDTFATAPAEPVPGGRDRELAEELGEISYYRNDIHWQSFVPTAERIIATHLAPERTEAAKVRAHLNDVQETLISTNNRMQIKDKAIRELSQQLAASEQHVKELENVVQAVRFEFDAIRRRIEGTGTSLNVIKYLLEQPTTPDAKGM